MKSLKNGWYILLYHNISWENNCYTSSIGGTIPPDRFRDQVKQLNNIGKLVSIKQGYNSWVHNSIDQPLFSFWFDDGMIGVLKNAKPLLDQYSITGAVSVCSQFLERQEFFWRFKLSYLNSIDGLRFLRSRLKKIGYKMGIPMRVFTLDNFSEIILKEIENLWIKSTTLNQREDAWRIFMNENEIFELINDGWEICNHTASHYPVSMESNLDIAISEFEECEKFLISKFDMPSKYWVIPFDYKSSNQLFEILKVNISDRSLVHVGNKNNKNFDMNKQSSIFRIEAQGTSTQLLKRLYQIGQT